MLPDRIARWMRPLLTVCLSATAVVLGFGVQAATEPAIEVGDPFPVWELTDQFDETHQLPGESTQVIVFVRSKQADETLAPVLESAVAESLGNGEVVYVSDISRMPGLISRLFALPALRDRSYPVVLVREEGVSAPLVTRTDCLALYRIERGTVAAREALCTEKDVTAAF